jgi:hypothetical protein
VGGGGTRASAREDLVVSIVRVGLSETEKFAEGWDAIFTKKKATKDKKPKAAVKAKSSTARKKKVGKARKK